MQSLEDGTRTWPGAVIRLSDGEGAPMYRPAAFVFDVPDGLAWVEPSYSDPQGAASPSLHRLPAERVEWNVFNGEVWRVMVLPYEPAEDQDLVGDSLEWFADWLKAEGRTWAEERERVRALIAESLT